jgi:hypothetical protein
VIRDAASIATNDRPIGPHRIADVERAKLARARSDESAPRQRDDICFAHDAAGRIRLSHHIARRRFWGEGDGIRSRRRGAFGKNTLKETE